MARAKRTARADARRRYRADQSVPEPLEPSERSDTTTRAGDSTVRERRLPSLVPAAASPTAFREAFRPLDIRSDIRALPSIAVGSKALWLPALLTLASTGLFVAVRPTTASDPLSLIAAFLFQYFIVTPAIGGVFIAGFLAPRASWLLGAIIGLLSAACYSFLILGGFIPLAEGAQRPNPSDVVGGRLLDLTDPRSALRLGRCLVSTLPDALEPEPRPTASGGQCGQASGWPKPRVGGEPEGRRPPLARARDHVDRTQPSRRMPAWPSWRTPPG